MRFQGENKDIVHETAPKEGGEVLLDRKYLKREGRIFL